MKLIIKNIYIFFIFLLLTAPANSNEIFVSLKKNKVNVRYGPSFESEVKYIYKKKNLPIRQIDKKENFRRIIDLKNNSGWIHASQVRKSKSFILLEDQLLFSKPTKFSKPIAKVSSGRLLLIKKCKLNWCRVKTENYTGWIKNENVWGSLE